ncbi:cation:proton antiporter [Marinimicrobium agarilyticum]|uniref:cation:proton antiporter domain-containing protein n=1 Tax=Marinimicrobium agarilyticum TaxID=306546 RepID=UPI00042370E5|nr:cation:proton antiporter [Marinimicrobium agarilyticum]
MHQFDIALLVIVGSALLLGLVSKFLKRIGLPDAVTLLLLGVALGPVGLGWLHPDSWGKPMMILEQVARLALAIGLMDIALRLPKPYVFTHWRSLLVVLGVGMLFMWLSSSVLVGAVLGLSWGSALLIGAVVTPTDPVVASSMVTGPVAEKTLPSHLRRIIMAESGANDGLAYVFVLGMIFFLTLSPPESLATRVVEVMVADVLLALLLGATIGYLAGFGLRAAEKKDLMDPQSVVMFATALALGTLPLVDLLGSNGILAVFVAGLAFDQQVGVRERRQEEHVVGGFDRFFTGPIFVLVGLMLPWSEWAAMGWPTVGLIISILLFRRLPVLLLLSGRLREVPSLVDGAFAGWFGPIGVAAVYYAALASHETDVPELWPVVSLLVSASVLVHGLTAVPFSHLYRRLTAS